MSLPGAGRAGQAGTSAGTVRERQAGGYHRFFSQFTVPVAHPLLDAAPVTAASTVLDAGSGPGYAARAARARGAHVAAIDLPADMLACARHADPLLPVVRADAGTLPVAGGVLTAVVADPHGTVRLPVSAVIAAAQRPPASSPRRPRWHRPTAASACRPSPGTP
jgi:SAM-dependent methyltransferase